MAFAAGAVGTCSYAYYKPQSFAQPLDFIKGFQYKTNMFTSSLAMAEQNVLVVGNNTVQAVPQKVGREHFKQELIATANAMAAKGKGILAADEAPSTMVSKFNGIGVDPSVENIRAYRELLFTAPGIEQYISAVIMFESTLNQRNADGSKSFKEILDDRNIIIGMNVDKGFAIIGGTTGEETASQGLDGLAERCQGYYARGVRFCKWRSVVKCHRANGGPSELALNETAHTLARYASIAQDNGLVPIIEPEVSLDGDHTLEECEAVSEMINSRVMQQMQAHKLIIEGCIIKPNMVTPGAQYTGPKPSREEIAQATVRALGRAYVPAIPGIMFLSGGQSEQDACLNLNAINQTGMKTPWAISFSYGRALQASVLEAWKGSNVEAGQAALLERSRANGEASLGIYGGTDSCHTTHQKNLHVKNYTY